MEDDLFSHLAEVESADHLDADDGELYSLPPVGEEFTHFLLTPAHMDPEGPAAAEAAAPAPEGPPNPGAEPSGNSRARNWLFTLNNPEGLLDEEQLRASGMTYCVYQEEVGEAGTHHYQGYIEFNSPKSLAAVKKIPGLEGAHWEVRRGTAAQAEAYCSKDDTRVGGPYRYGTPRQQGKRNDILAAKRAIDEGADQWELTQEHFPVWLRHHSALATYANMVQRRRLEEPYNPIVFLFVGPAGTGKTRTANTLARMLGSVYTVAQPKRSGTYFDGYSQETSMIFDEFDGNFMRPTEFNIIFDRQNAASLPVHGGQGPVNRSKYLFICSNYLPKFWWKNRNQNQRRQTERRIHCTWFFGQPQAARPEACPPQAALGVSAQLWDPLSYM